LNVFCGREELESFQIVIAPTTVPSFTIAWNAAFSPALASGTWFEVARAGFSPVSPWGQVKKKKKRKKKRSFV
jgi:hypothetical protein